MRIHAEVNRGECPLGKLPALGPTEDSVCPLGREPPGDRFLGS